MPRSSSKMGDVGARRCTDSRKYIRDFGDINGAMDRRPLLMLASAALLFGWTVTTSVRADPASLTISVPAQAPAMEAGNYVGPGSCSAVACHGAIRPASGGRILQTEYSTWI